MIYNTTIEQDCAEQFSHPPYSGCVLSTCMELIHYEEWRNGNRDGTIERMFSLASKYGAKFRDVNLDMYFRAEYKMLKGPMPTDLHNLIFKCFDFSNIKPSC